MNKERIMDEGFLAAVVTGAAVIGALVMKLGGSLFNGSGSNANSLLTAELQEMRRVVHTNTRVMDDLRQEITHLRTAISEIKGILKG
jgi:hypothetical protein